MADQHKTREESARKAQERRAAVEAFMMLFVKPGDNFVIRQLHEVVAEILTHVSSAKREGDRIRVEVFAGYDVGVALSSVWKVQGLTQMTVVCCINGIEITMAKKGCTS